MKRVLTNTGIKQAFSGKKHLLKSFTIPIKRKNGFQKLLQSTLPGPTPLDEFIKNNMKQVAPTRVIKSKLIKKNLE